jgi:DNA-binding NarL/FixJ family response regulator
MITVLVADDHAPTRSDIVRLLEADGRFHVTAQASDATTAVALAVDRRPKVCLLDIRMPGGGISAAWEISARLPTTRIVMFTVSDKDEDLFPALRAGAHGYLLKDTPPERLLDKLDRIAHGEAVLSRALTARIVDQFRDPAPRRRSIAHLEGAGHPRLTSREWQVLELMQRGLTSTAIARHLSVAPVTVRTHTASILKKLRVQTRGEALDRFPGVERSQR